MIKFQQPFIAEAAPEFEVLLNCPFIAKKIKFSFSGNAIVTNNVITNPGFLIYSDLVENYVGSISTNVISYIAGVLTTNEELRTDGITYILQNPDKVQGSIFFTLRYFDGAELTAADITGGNIIGIIEYFK